MLRRYNFNRLAHFVAIVDAGSITGAADALGLSKAVVSKQLQLLEGSVGTPLVVRNTRHLQPTAAGIQFYEDAKSALTLANNAYERVQDPDKTPQGLLRMTAPVDFGVSYVAPFVARFQETYPDVTIDLNLSDSVVDIIADRYDLAFRIGWLADSSNLARRLLEFKEIAVCSSSTAERVKVKSPKDLADIPFLRSHVFAGKTEWVFESEGQTETVTTRVVAEMNVTLALKACVAEGFCFTVFPDILVRDDLEDGRLVRLLPKWSLRKGGVYTVTPPNRVRSNALQRFLDMIHESLSDGNRR